MEDLVETHRSQSFDHTGIAKDPNLALPLQRLNELLEQGLIGSINHRHASFMGSITAPGRMMRDTAPEIARGLLEDGVDRVLLVPV
jgi:D-proline reductase (dithiol) PrdB